MGALGIVSVAASGFAFRFPPEVREIARIEPHANSGFNDRCFLEKSDTFADSCVETGGKPLVVLWGDSTAAALYPGLKAAEDKRGSFRLAQFTSAGCAPILDSGTNGRCDAISRGVFNFLRSTRPDLVLIHAMWAISNDLSKLHDTVAQLRAAGVPRIVL